MGTRKESMPGKQQRIVGKVCWKENQDIVKNVCKKTRNARQRNAWKKVATSWEGSVQKLAKN